MRFTDEQMERYSRHIILPEIGGRGQERLLAARVLIVGAGGLGSPAALYLAAAGIGSLTIIDFDDVQIDNLQRQIAHATSSVGKPKAISVRDRLSDLNPDVQVKGITARLARDNILDLLAEHDAVVDGSDNFPTRYLVNDACQMTKTPLFTGAVLRFEGQVTTFKMQGEGPCYRCLFPEPPAAGLIPSCQEAGILGSVVGMIGTIQATEVLKHFAEIGESLEGTLMLFDAVSMEFRRITVRKTPDCPLCGVNPRITELVEEGQFCEDSPQ
ncbi:molybdopterin-synthase adenylyltransferase MoeB [Candidatus Sumerlaeota bacterium]|nr:molybdopterin-synthase adenylyltransferase MoeB [Candidatus Sumerlaeota bacterium]